MPPTHRTVSARAPHAVAAMAFTLLVAAGTAVRAQPAVPPSVVASPDIYRVLVENEQHRVVAVSWKPGQRDLPHAHPASATYFVTDCALRLRAPGGEVRDAFPRAGTAVMQAPIAQHEVENIGSAECRLVMFEVK